MPPRILVFSALQNRSVSKWACQIHIEALFVSPAGTSMVQLSFLQESHALLYPNNRAISLRLPLCCSASAAYTKRLCERLAMAMKRCKNGTGLGATACEVDD